jgi:GT2 family glycosyltransferase
MNPFTVVTVSMPERHGLLAEAGESLRAQTIGRTPWLIRCEEPDRFGPEHVALQRNAILKAVETEWIAVLDDDDLFDEDYLEIMAEYTDGADVVYSDCRGYPHPKSEFFDPERLRTNNYIDGEACIRTEALRSVGGYPANHLVEDWQLWVKLLDIGARFVYVDKVIRTHRHGTLNGNAWRNVTG